MRRNERNLFWFQFFVKSLANIILGMALGAILGLIFTFFADYGTIESQFDSRFIYIHSFGCFLIIFLWSFLLSSLFPSFFKGEKATTGARLGIGIVFGFFLVLKINPDFYPIFSLISTLGLILGIGFTCFLENRKRIPWSQARDRILSRLWMGIGR